MHFTGDGRTQPNGFYTFYLEAHSDTAFKEKLREFLTYIQTLKTEDKQATQTPAKARDNESKSKKVTRNPFSYKHVKDDELLKEHENTKIISTVTGRIDDNNLYGNKEETKDFFQAKSNQVLNTDTIATKLHINNDRHIDLNRNTTFLDNKVIESLFENRSVADRQYKARFGVNITNSFSLNMNNKNATKTSDLDQKSNNIRSTIVNNRNETAEANRNDTSHIINVNDKYSIDNTTIELDKIPKNITNTDAYNRNKTSDANINDTTHFATANNRQITESNETIADRDNKFNNTSDDDRNNKSIDARIKNNKAPVVKTTQSDDANIKHNPDTTTTINERKNRQKRFISFLKRSETSENDNFLFKMLEFLMKNRKNVIPVISVMREINTLVKSGNGELNHVTKERNNYIGSSAVVPPVATYSLELGGDSKVVAFVKRLIGMTPKGDRLTIAGK